MDNSKKEPWRTPVIREDSILKDETGRWRSGHSTTSSGGGNNTSNPPLVIDLSAIGKSNEPG